MPKTTPLNFNKINPMSQIATIEISDCCNAKCRWCTRGIQNLTALSKGSFMTAELFKKGLQRLLEIGWITKDTKIELFNWGEPFLNPQLDNILQILIENELSFYLSTNGSVYRELSQEVIKNIDFLMFSIPGFSAASYEKIHQLNFETIKKNIKRYTEVFSKYGAENKIMINFHVYQFNLSELEQARMFSDYVGTTFIARTAYFNDYSLCQDFLTGKMNKEDLYDAASQLFMDFYKPHDSVNDYCCPLWNQVCFDHEFNLVPCCRLTSNEKLGNLFHDKPADLLHARRTYHICTECIRSGQSYITTHGQRPFWYEDDVLPKLRLAEQADSTIEIKEAQLQAVNKAKAQVETALKMEQEAMEIKETQFQAVSKAKAQIEAVLKAEQEAMEIKEAQLQTAIFAQKQTERELSVSETERNSQYRAYIRAKDALNKSVQECAVLRSELEAVSAELEALRTSISWKITKPLRMVKGKTNPEDRSI